MKSRSANGVQHGVEEAQWVLSRRDQRVVQEGDDGPKSRCRCGRAADKPSFPLVVDEEPSRLRRDIRVCLRERKGYQCKCERLIQGMSEWVNVRGRRYVTGKNKNQVRKGAKQGKRRRKDTHGL